MNSRILWSYTFVFIVSSISECNHVDIYWCISCVQEEHLHPTVQDFRYEGKIFFAYWRFEQVCYTVVPEVLGWNASLNVLNVCIHFSYLDFFTWFWFESWTIGKFSGMDRDVHGLFDTKSFCTCTHAMYIIMCHSRQQFKLFFRKVLCTNFPFVFSNKAIHKVKKIAE